MTDSNNSSQASPPLPISQFESLWARWGREQDWKSSLQKKATHKALDIPEDDVNINVDKSDRSTTTGLSSLATVGLMAGSALLGGGIPTALMLGSGLLGQLTKSDTTTNTTNTTNQSPAAQLLFYDQDMNPIKVDRTPDPK